MEKEKGLLSQSFFRIVFSPEGCIGYCFFFPPR